MITWLRTADEGEAAFFALVAGEAGIPSGCCSDTGTALTRVVTTDGQVSGFYRVRFDSGCAHDRAELDYLHVHQHRRGGGLGRVLVQDVHRSVVQLGARGVRILAHPPVEPFFRAVGARRVGTEPAGVRAPWARPVLQLDAADAQPAGARPVLRSAAR